MRGVVMPTNIISCHTVGGSGLSVTGGGAAIGDPVKGAHGQPVHPLSGEGQSPEPCLLLRAEGEIAEGRGSRMEPYRCENCDDTGTCPCGGAGCENCGEPGRCFCAQRPERGDGCPPSCRPECLCEKSTDGAIGSPPDGI